LNPERYLESHLLNDLAYSDKSIIISGSNGSGKSHTLSLYLRLLYEQTRNKDQVASTWILARKNDSFCGLREADKLVIFNTLDPSEAFKLIEKTYKNFQARLKVVEEVDRVNLPPLRLILEDWSSTVMILKKAHKTLWTKIELMLLDIITVGREYNVCLVILTHTIGLEALGLVVDSNLRANLTIVVQGLIRSELGKIKGDYLLIELAIKNQYIVPDNSLRSVYLTQVNDLIPESRKQQIPIYFTTLGNRGVGLLPYIQKSNIDFTDREIEEDLIFRDSKEFRLSDSLEDEDIRDSLERLYELEEEKEEINDIIEVKSQENSELEDSEIIYYTALRLNRKNAIELIRKLKIEMKHTQTQIIWILWNAKPGVTKSYKNAVSEYKELMKDETNEE
jgi:hypothetical protein